MSESLIPSRDLDFLLYEWLGADNLFSRPEFSDHSRETIDPLLDLSEQLAADHFLPHYKDADKNEPYLDKDGVHVLPAIGKALKAYADVGLFAAGFPTNVGGGGVPFTFSTASFAQFLAANVATSAYVMLTVANARLIQTFGSEAQRRVFAAPQIAGRWFGTMCLSEPQAGSSLAEIITRADVDGEDELGRRYRLHGRKMWISGGDQDVSDNIVHLVLAKIPNADGTLPDGTKGLSLFIVPKKLPSGQLNDIAIAGLNHKMGYRGTSNCLLNFGENDGAIGWVIGEPGQGLRQMFLMMNDARINVGLGAAALAYRGYRHSVTYARDRRQGRPIGAEAGVPIAIIDHPDVKRMLLAQKAYAEGALALCLYCATLVDKSEDPEIESLLGLLTPVAKTWPSEYGLVANDLAIQIHGGYGYTRDFDVEQIYRDNRLNPIHEGTTGIQAIDLLRRKILRDQSNSYTTLRDRVEQSCARADEIPHLVAHAVALKGAFISIDQTIDVLKLAPQPKALENATLFLGAFGHAVVAWLWLDQAITASARLVEGHDSFYAGKLSACRFFFDYELTKLPSWLAPVIALNDTAASAPSEIF